MAPRWPACWRTWRHSPRPPGSGWPLTWFYGAMGAHLSKEFGTTDAAGRAIRRGAVVVVLTWIPVGTLIVLSNVVFPSKQDDDGPWLLGGYLVIFAALACAGLTRTRTEGRMAAGAVAGVILGVLTIATFAGVDNVFLQIVSQQQAKITGFQQSGMTSMRAYINSSLVPAGIFFSIEFAFFGALLAIGGRRPIRLLHPNPPGRSPATRPRPVSRPCGHRRRGSGSGETRHICVPVTGDSGSAVTFRERYRRSLRL